MTPFMVAATCELTLQLARNYIRVIQSHRPVLTCRPRPWCVFHWAIRDTARLGDLAHVQWVMSGSLSFVASAHLRPPPSNPCAARSISNTPRHLRAPKARPSSPRRRPPRSSSWARSRPDTCSRCRGQFGWTPCLWFFMAFGPWAGNL